MKQANQNSNGCGSGSLLDEQYRSILRRLFDVVTEIDLVTGRYRQVDFGKAKLFRAPEKGDYSAEFAHVVGSLIREGDARRIGDVFSLDGLRRALAAGQEEMACDYRLETPDGGSVWMESRVYLIATPNGPFAFLTARDITQRKEEEAQRRIAKQYDAALRRIYDELYELNLTRDSYRIVYHTVGKYVTPAESGALGAAIGEVAGRMIHPEDQARFLAFFDMEAVRAAFAAGKECLLAEFRKLWEDGAYHWAALTLFPVKVDDDADEIYLCFIMDIDEKKRADVLAEQNRLLRKRWMDDERYRIIVEQTNAIVCEWNRDAGKYYISPRMSELFEGDYTQSDLLDILRDGDVVYPEDRARIEQFTADYQRGAPTCQMQLRLKHKTRGYIWCRLFMTCIYDTDHRLRRAIATINDVDEALRAEQALKFRAEFDTLTGIYNMETFYQKAARLLTEHPETPFALIRMDINRFKFINDLYGMEEGDKLLRYIAGCIQREAGDDGVYGRLGGDVFCMLVPFSRETELPARAQRLSAQISQYGLGRRAVPSFGICVVDDRTIPVSLLCDRANLALQTVKGNLVRQWAFYDEKLRARQLEDRAIEEEMEQALAQGQFEVYLQPKHNIRDGRVVGAEALVRWNHPRRGLLLPGGFIPLFERNGFVVRLDEFVWERVCRLLQSWSKRGRSPVPISVNVSRLHTYTADLCDRLTGLTARYGVPCGLLDLEVTESTFVDNTGELYRTMARLRGAGFTVSMDDFGSGYSSLNMLKDSPVDNIKIDRAFLNESVTSRRTQMIVAYTITLARELNLGVIAEGVESERQAAFLLESNCNVAQGFYFSRPMPIVDFERLVFGDAPSAV